MIIPEEICQTIERADNIVLLTHVHPDGDALGSLFGFADILESQGKEVFCYLEEPVSYLYQFLPGSDRAETSLTKLIAFVEQHSDVIAVSLDCGDSDRMGKNKEMFLQIHPFLVIDHHRAHKNYGNFRWIDPDRSSTGEMVYELAQHYNVDITYECACNLYVAISTDTGSFRYDSTTPRTLRIAADLVEKGIQPDEIAGHIYDNYTLERIKLMEMVLGTLTLYESERLAFIYVTEAMFANSGALPEDIEGFIDYARSISSVKVAVFIKEGKKGMVSVSLRAKGDCDVAEIAKSFGGGGHRNAAGFRFVDKSSDQVRQIVLSKLKKALHAT